MTKRIVFEKSFKVGDKVRWKSQAAGVFRIKIGVVKEVVPTGERPKTMTRDCGSSRGHESYVVIATTDDVASKTRSYWPRTAQLELIEDGPGIVQAAG